MTTLATKEEYQAIADGLTIASTAFIDGGFRAARSGRSFASVNPATGDKLADVAACDGQDVDFAVAKARESFEDGRWSRLAPGDRKAILIRLAKLIKRNAPELAVLESLDSGKPIRDCVTIDIPEVVNTLIWHAEAIDKIYDQTAPVGADALAIIERCPIGVVGVVLPWNFPLLMLAWKLGPALAAGNSLVVKPAEQTSLTALRFAELAMEAGLPRGVLNVVTGDGPGVGQPLGLHPDVDMISFTGSTETGKRFLRYSADSNMKKVALECGGKNPAVVLSDAEQLDIVAEHIVNGAFWNMGENCSAASRLIVHRDVKAPLMAAMVARAREWRTGDPLDPTNHLGALIDKDHVAKVCAYLDKGEAVVGGKGQGAFVEPTIFDGVSPDSLLAQEEIFGPLLSVIEVASDDEAIRLANQSQYGLTASLFSGNIKKALRGARDLRAGTVTVNCFGEGDITTPFGGFKQSGFWGRDNGLAAHDQYTEIKTIWIDLSDRIGEELAR